MANPDIPAALAVLETHLVNAGSALTAKILDVDRGILTYSPQPRIRYYWSGEVPPPHMAGPRVLNGQMVGQRFSIVAAFPITGLTEDLLTALDGEMQTLAGEIRTRIQGDSQLGGYVTDLDLDYGTPADVTFAQGRAFVMTWDLDLSYVEYAIAA